MQRVFWGNAERRSPLHRPHVSFSVVLSYVRFNKLGRITSLTPDKVWQSGLVELPNSDGKDGKHRAATVDANLQLLVTAGEFPLAIKSFENEERAAWMIPLSRLASFANVLLP